MNYRRLTLAILGCLLAPFGAQAQDDAPTTARRSDAKQLAPIVVTGTAVPRIDADAPSPVAVISQQQIERAGLSTVADVLQALTADNAGSISNAFTNGFAAGASGVSLRGLTVNSTLVLVDGQRNATYAANDIGQRAFVDLNTIPLVAVDRIEVLKDGASSLYGADAIAGVVNIILKPAYKGVQGSVQTGSSQHGGGFRRRASFLAGSGDLIKDGHNGYVAVQYSKDNAIWLRDRGFPYDTRDLRAVGGSNTNAGRPSLRAGSVYGSVTPGTLRIPGDLASGVPYPGALSQPLRPCGTDAIAVNGAQGGYCEQNFQSLYGQAQPAMEQLGLYGRFTVKLDDDIQAYVSASYAQTHTWTPLSPRQIQNSTPRNTNGIALPPGHPDNPFPHDYALINYAFGDIPASFDYDNHNARVVGGIAGTYDAWNYTAAVVLNHTWLDTRQRGYIEYNALMDAIRRGTYRFTDPAANSAGVRATLAPGYRKTSTSDLDSLDLSANRSLVDLDGGPLGFAMGAQFRREAQDSPPLNPGFVFLGLGNTQGKGGRTVSAAYVEFDAPLLKSLEMDVSGRFDHYSDVGGHFTPKVGIKWTPLDWLALRGTYSKGFRAPSFAENGSSSTQLFINHTPPAAFVAAHGGNGNGYATPYRLSIFNLANKHIRPEKARNFTLGLLLQPADWLHMSLDYFNIRKADVIGPADAAVALDNYYAGRPLPAGMTVIPDTPDPLHPNALPRPAVVESEYINATSLKTSGIDLDVQARFGLGGGMQYTSRLTGTQIFDWTMTLPDGKKMRFAGTHGPYILASSTGTPRRRIAWANTLETARFGVTATLYHVSGMSNRAPDVGAPGACLSDVPVSCRIGSFTNIDLAGSYRLDDHTVLTLSVMNALDRKPPFDPANYAANYNPAYAQAGIVGRFYNLGLNFKL
jgi:iron complex outermembrane receptor protein